MRRPRAHNRPDKVFSYLNAPLCGHFVRPPLTQAFLRLPSCVGVRRPLAGVSLRMSSVYG